MSPRRLYGPVVLGTLAAGGFAFLATSRTWAHVKVATDGLPSDTVDVTGTDAQPLISAFAVVVVTAALAVLAASPRVRRVVGVFTLLLSVAGVVLVLASGPSLDDAVQRAVRESPAFTGRGDADFTSSAWRYAAAAGFAAAGVLGALTAWFGARWPTMGSRFEAPATRTAATTTESQADLWKALDEGRDPTK